MSVFYINDLSRGSRDLHNSTLDFSLFSNVSAYRRDPLRGTIKKVIGSNTAMFSFSQIWPITYLPLSDRRGPILAAILSRKATIPFNDSVIDGSYHVLNLAHDAPIGSRISCIMNSRQRGV